MAVPIEVVWSAAAYRGQQIRHRGTSDEKNENHRERDERQDRARGSDDHVVERPRLDPTPRVGLGILAGQTRGYDVE